MSFQPRVALFCETYHEINGVALTARQLVAYAKRHDFPLLAIHGGKQPGVHTEGSVRRIELRRSWLSIGIERDLEFDFAFCRYGERIRRELLRFQPDVIHITSPGRAWGTWCVSLVEAENSLGGFLAHEFPPICGTAFAEIDSFPARENCAANGGVVAAARAADPVVVLRVRRRHAGAHQPAGGLAAEGIGKAIVSDAQGSGCGAVPSET